MLTIHHVSLSSSSLELLSLCFRIFLCVIVNVLSPNGDKENKVVWCFCEKLECDQFCKYDGDSKSICTFAPICER